LKTAFKILTGSASQRECHLLLEAGRDGISLLWYSKDPLRVEGLVVYQAQKNSTDSTLAEDIQQLLAAENLPHYHSVVICYNFKESLIVPDEYYQAPLNVELLNSVYGDMPGNSYYSETVEGLNAVNIYRVPDVVKDALNNRFFAAATRHSNSLQIPLYKNKSLYCIVYNSSIKVILFNQGSLQLVQLYDYTTPSDVAYHLLNTCTQHQLSPAETVLTLSGLIDQESNLYEELYRYFLYIEMDELPADIQLPDEIGELPGHFFSFLISLTKCVL
jgi:hypothetical protein